jgi:hypothetical protein
MGVTEQGRRGKIVSIHGRHAQRLGDPIFFGVLKNAETVDPEVLDLAEPGIQNGVTVCLWQLGNRHTPVSCRRTMPVSIGVVVPPCPRNGTR